MLPAATALAGSTDTPEVGLQLRPLDPAADAALLHRWATQDYAAFWGMQERSVEDVRRTYEEMLRRPRSQAFIGNLEGDPRPLLLLETYHGPDDAVLARHYDARPGDRGFHLLMAPPAERPKHVSNVGFHVLRGICRHLLSDAQADRIIGEPDLRNTTVLRFLLQGGFELGQVVYLPHKTAQMVFMTRPAFERLPARPAPRCAEPVPARKVWMHVQIGKVLRKLGIAR